MHIDCPFIVQAAKHADFQTFEIVEKHGGQIKDTGEIGVSTTHNNIVISNILGAIASQDNPTFLKKVIKRMKDGLEYEAKEQQFIMEQPFTKEYSGFTPLMIAVVHSSEETIKTFIQSGSDINKRDSNGNTILQICAIYKRLDNLRYFLKFHSIDAKLKNNSGQTVL